MLVLAFQTDSTRVATFLLAHDGSNRSFKDIGVSDGHHYLSHHQNDQEKLEKIAKIDLFYVEQYAYFIDRLRQTRDLDGKSVLDNSAVIYCSGLSDANRHLHNDLPVVVAGRAGGALTPGRHVKLENAVPMTNFYVKLLNVLGVKVDHFGDSTGVFENVMAGVGVAMDLRSGEVALPFGEVVGVEDEVAHPPADERRPVAQQVQPLLGRADGVPKHDPSVTDDSVEHGALLAACAMARSRRRGRCWPRRS